MMFPKGQDLDIKIWPDSTLIYGGSGKNLETGKLSHFLYLLDFQVLSQQVLTRVVINF